MRPWQPRPRRAPRGIVIAACTTAWIVAGLTVFAAYSEWAANREFNEAMALHDATRVTAKQVERIGEEIAMQTPRPRTAGVSVRATFYADSYTGKTMANGMPYLPDQLTCAHRTLPLGTVAELEYKGRTVRVTVTDRGPWDKYPSGPRYGLYRKELDLSAAAFRALEPDTEKGVITVIARVVKP